MEKEKEQRRAWYVIHTYSGYENKVKEDLERKIRSAGMDDKVFEIVVPMEDVVEVKGTKTDGEGKIVKPKKTTKRKIFPSYVLVDMIVTPQTWYVIRNTTGVTGFVGSDNKEPTPLTDEEAQRILSANGGRVERYVLDAQIGDTVRIKSGTLANHEAVVTEIDEANHQIRANVKLFGSSETSVELEFDQVERL